MLDSATLELKKQTENQEKIINLLERLIVMVAASSIADPADSVGNYDRMNAANYAQKVFNENK